MWSSVGLTLLVGACLGLIVDRVLLQQPVALAQPAPQRGPMYFTCSRSSVDVENEPGYYYPERFRKRLVEGLSDELNLSASQRQDLESMLEEKRAGAKAFWQRIRHAYCDIRDGFRSDIRELLDEPQRLEFDQMMAELDRRQRERDLERLQAISGQ